MKLRCLALLVLFVSSFDTAVASASVSAAEARSIAKEVYIFGAAYVDNYRVYIKAPVDANHLLPGVRFNEFLHLRQLVGPEVGDTPNNDTLFSYTILDPRREPVAISVPEVADDRLYMRQMGEVTTNTLPYISSGTSGTNAGDYVIVGPSHFVLYTVIQA